MVGVKTMCLLFLAMTILMSGRASAQFDLSGEIFNLRSHEEGWNEEIGDYAGVPVNGAGRLRADTWMPSLLALPEHQCKPHGADRVENFGGMRVWKEVDLATQEFVAYHILVQWLLMHRVIYMDGRPHPSDYAPRTFMGFSTGAWDGNNLRVRTSHLKESWLRRNGLMRSEKAALTERLIRHEDFLILGVHDRRPGLPFRALHPQQTGCLSPPARPLPGISLRSSRHRGT